VTRNRFVLACLLLSLFATDLLFAGASDKPADPTFLGPYITFQRDPLTTATVHWLSSSDRTPVSPRVSDEAGNAVAVPAITSRAFPTGPLSVRYVELTGLKPGTEYRFALGEPEAEKEYRFRTLPAASKEPLRIAVGGDMMHKTEWMEATCKQAAAKDVHFAILGGDLAYENGDLKQAKRVYDWIRVWTATMRDSRGRLIPFIPVIGNHEVQGGYGGTREKAPFFYAMFALPGNSSVYTVDAGNYLSLLVLDTDHVEKIEDQEAHLEKTLPARAQVPHLFCAYHWPVYGTAKDLPDPAAGKRSQKMLKHWVPHFEKHGVDVCFEHDHHTYKRTPLIRAGQKDPNGILYLGDGAWGVQTRPVAKDMWYHAHAAPRRHFILCTLQGTTRAFEAIDSDGTVFDRWPEK
jgi:acid phosphatase type 7